MTDRRPPLILASASPRRRQLLEGIVGRVEVMAADVDESPRLGESSVTLVTRLALAKAETIALRHRGRTVVGADTVVVVDDEILGKPTDAADAATMLGRLSGRIHHVVTGLAVVGVEGGADVATPPAGPLVTSECTEVSIRTLAPAEIAWYVGTGEPLDKAGAYAIQGGAALFVERVVGSYDNVVGLPLHSLDRTLALCGRSLLDWVQPD